MAESIDNAAFLNTDDAPPDVVMAALLHCAYSWDGRDWTICR